MAIGAAHVDAGWGAHHHGRAHEDDDLTVAPSEHSRVSGSLTALRTCVRMGDAGSAYARFQRALRTGNLSLIRAAAVELPQVDLGDALAVCMAIRDAEPERFERTALRWLARYAVEPADNRPSGPSESAKATAIADPQLSCPLSSRTDARLRCLRPQPNVDGSAAATTASAARGDAGVPVLPQCSSRARDQVEPGRDRRAALPGPVQQAG
jgi:hypothetical protein